MRIIIYFLFSYLNKLPEKLKNVSDEEGERFNKDIQLIEKRYHGVEA